MDKILGHALFTGHPTGLRLHHRRESATAPLLAAHMKI